MIYVRITFLIVVRKPPNSFGFGRSLARTRQTHNTNSASAGGALIAPFPPAHRYAEIPAHWLPARLSPGYSGCMKPIAATPCSCEGSYRGSPAARRAPARHSSRLQVTAEGLLSESHSLNEFSIYHLSKSDNSCQVEVGFWVRRIPLPNKFGRARSA